jgi:hypothetical protein
MVKHVPELHKAAGSFRRPLAATFANELLTKMIKARLLKVQPGPD